MQRYKGLTDGSMTRIAKNLKAQQSSEELLDIPQSLMDLIDNLGEIKYAISDLAWDWLGERVYQSHRPEFDEIKSLFDQAQSNIREVQSPLYYLYEIARGE